MVRFRDFHKTREGSAATDGGRLESALNGNGQPPGEAAMDPIPLFEDAAHFLETVFSAVKDRKRVALDPGFRIARQIVESYSPGDALFVQTIQNDDPRNYLVNKCINVAIYAVRVARQLGYARERQVEIGVAGLLHEVGMILVPEHTIYKKEKLSRKEWKVIQQHSESGYHVLKPYSGSHPYLAEVALQIHERIDGSGYPQGLKGDEIHDYAQIIGLADIYEALSHSRPYRDRYNHFHVIKEIINTCKAKFHKKHLKALLNAFSIFPLSTYVRLNSNAVGRVIETYPEQPMRPRLQISFDSQGRKVLTERIVNLPENALLYIVDSVSGDEIEQLERGHPFQAAPEPLENREFSSSPPSAPQVKQESASFEELPSRPADPAAGRSGKRPLMGLLIFVLLAGGISVWQGRVPEAPLSAEKAVPAKALRDEAPAAAEAHRAPAIAHTKATAFAAEVAGPFRIQTDSGQAASFPSEGPANRKASDHGEKAPAIAVASFEQELSETPADNLPRDGQPRVAAKADPPPSTGPLRWSEAPPEADVYRSARWPYSLLLSSFRSEVLTRRAMSVYRGRGFSPYCVKVDLGEDGLWYRLFSGHYATFDEASAAVRAAAVKGAVVKKTRYANLIAAGLPDKEAEDILADLTDRGVSPYTVRSGRGSVDLFVGAFYTRKGAENLRDELLSQGVQNRVVQR